MDESVIRKTYLYYRYSTPAQNSSIYATEFCSLTVLFRGIQLAIVIIRVNRLTK